MALSRGRRDDVYCSYSANFAANNWLQKYYFGDLMSSFNAKGKFIGL